MVAVTGVVTCGKVGKAIVHVSGSIYYREGDWERVGGRRKSEGGAVNALIIPTMAFETDALGDIVSVAVQPWIGE